MCIVVVSMGNYSRIVSRKIWIMAIYEQLTLLQVADNGMNDYRFPLFQDVSSAMVHMLYMAERFFTNGEKTKTEIADLVDVEYLKPLISQWDKYYQAVMAAVNNNSQTFDFVRMDPMDKAIFLGGGVEYLVHKTPFKILLNEMIEIAKRYGDEGSPRLVNGIGHKILEELQDDGTSSV